MIKHAQKPSSKRRFTGLLKDEEGAYAVEFAFVAPLFFMLLFGTMDFGYYLYNQSMLSGMVNAASRDGSLEGSTSADIDAKVKDMLIFGANDAEITFDRKNFDDFASAGKPEPYVDVNGNKKCDNGEAYQDTNGNNTWDTGGRSGGGGARDVVVYEVTMKYPRILPVHTMLGLDEKVVLKAKTLVENQPFNRQTQHAYNTRNCS